MEIVFVATIKNDNSGSWCINLCDINTNEQRVCSSLDDFEAQLVELSNQYGGQIDEVRWEMDKDVSDEHFYEIQGQMRQIQQELNK